MKGDAQKMAMFHKCWWIIRIEFSFNNLTTINGRACNEETPINRDE